MKKLEYTFIDYNIVDNEEKTPYYLICDARIYKKFKIGDIISVEYLVDNNIQGKYLFVLLKGNILVSLLYFSEIVYMISNSKSTLDNTRHDMPINTSEYQVITTNAIGNKLGEVDKENLKKYMNYYKEMSKNKK